MHGQQNIKKKMLRGVEEQSDIMIWLGKMQHKLWYLFLGG